MRKHLALLLAGAAAAGAAMIPAQASASAYGIQYWTKFNVNVGGQTIGVPAGQLAHLIEGKGTYVKKDAANFMTPTRSICNWRIDFRYTDVEGRVYERNRGSIHYSCNNYGERFTWPYHHKRPGKTCAELYTNGAFVARQCHSILR